MCVFLFCLSSLCLMCVVCKKVVCAFGLYVQLVVFVFVVDCVFWLFCVISACSCCGFRYHGLCCSCLCVC